jgi:hypothetical protein
LGPEIADGGVCAHRGARHPEKLAPDRAGGTGHRLAVPAPAVAGLRHGDFRAWPVFIAPDRGAGSEAGAGDGGQEAVRRRPVGGGLNPPVPACEAGTATDPVVGSCCPGCQLAGRHMPAGKSGCGGKDETAGRDGRGGAGRLAAAADVASTAAEPRTRVKTAKSRLAQARECPPAIPRSLPTDGPSPRVLPSHHLRGNAKTTQPLPAESAVSVTAKPRKCSVDNYIAQERCDRAEGPFGRSGLFCARGDGQRGRAGEAPFRSPYSPATAAGHRVARPRPQPLRRDRDSHRARADGPTLTGDRDRTGHPLSWPSPTTSAERDRGRRRPETLADECHEQAVSRRLVDAQNA